MASITDSTTYGEGHKVILKSTVTNKVIKDNGYIPGKSVFTITKKTTKAVKVNLGGGTKLVKLIDPDGRIINLAGSASQIDNLFNHHTTTKAAASGGGSLSKNALRPKKFGLLMSPVTADQIVSKVTAGLKQMVASQIISMKVSNFCRELVKHSYAGKTEFVPDFSGIDVKQIAIVAADFGEVTGAIYMLKQEGSKFSHAKFPTEENERLVDYYLVNKTTKEDHPFSAKADQGGAPAITAVAKELIILKEQRKIPTKYQTALKVIQLLSIEKTKDDPISGNFRGPLLAAEYLNTPGWNALINILKIPEFNTGYTAGLPTEEQLMTAVKAAGKYPACMKYFNPLMLATNTKEKPDTTKRTINTPSGIDKPWGILHYPITSELVAWLNTDSNNAKQLLTMAARMKTVSQVYLDVLPKANPKTAKYSTHTFSDADFEFRSPSSIPKPTNNRMGFSMIKKSIKKSTT
jgi:hypothetical protein